MDHFLNYFSFYYSTFCLLVHHIVLFFCFSWLCATDSFLVLITILIRFVTSYNFVCVKNHPAVNFHLFCFLVSYLDCEL
jgi:hypothetical protein